jgi:prepilin-type N-terminal cleavage/methylation domain-containing protein
MNGEDSSAESRFPRQKAYTLLEIMIVVAIIGLLAVISIPAMMKARIKSQTTVCLNNLRQIDAAKDQASFERRWGNGTPVATGDANVNNYIKGLAGTTNTPRCPSGGTYGYNAVGTFPACSVEGHTLPAL